MSWSPVRRIWSRTIPGLHIVTNVKITPIEIADKFFLANLNVKATVAKKIIITGNLRANTFTPKNFINNTCIQVVKGSLVLRWSINPSYS